MTKIILKIVKEIAKAYKPLVDAARGEPGEKITGEKLIEFFKVNLGCYLNLTDDNRPIFISTITEIIQVYDSISTVPDDPLKLLELLTQVDTFVNLTYILGNIGSLEFDSEQDAEEFQELGIELLNYLIMSYLHNEYPIIYYIFVLLGVIHQRNLKTPEPITEDSILILDWDNLFKLYSAPAEVFESIYGWATPNFSPHPLFWNILYLFEALGIFGHMEDEDTQEISLEIPLFETESFEVGGKLLPINDEASGTVEGIALIPYGAAQLTLPIDLCFGWVLKLGSSASSDVNFGILLRPHGNISIGPVEEGSIISPDIFLTIEIFKKPRDKETTSKIILIGKPDGTRLEATSVGMKAGIHVGTQISNEYFVQGNLEKSVIIIKGSEGDGFLQKILPSNGIQVPFDLAVGWSNLTGLYFKGSAGLEITIPIHKNVGPIRFDSIYLKSSITQKGEINIITSASVGVKLGPFSASVNRLGLKTLIQIGHTPKVDFQFNPPTGIGLAIEVSGLTGGGFLDFDHVNKRYTGILKLKFGEIGFTAIGLITTKMPDGSADFSMLLSINVTFSPAFTLPYNIKLHAIGGLIGINRTMNVERVRKGLRSGILKSIMFPEDPIANASKIISDMRSVFPPHEGRYVLAPLVKLSWSEIIFAELGLLIELPQPIRIAILGKVYSELPTKKIALIKIHLDVLGVLDFDKKTFALDASLYDSSIANFTITGDAAMRLCWGKHPNFALAIGGFHPRFKAPPNFPSLRRLKISLGSGNNPRLNLESYLAITSNSAQFGASLDVYASAGVFSIKGQLGFDTLFRFNPFYFEADIGANVAAYMGKKAILTIYLDLDLKGPSPWQAKGKVSFKVLFVKITIRIDKKWGKSKKVFIPAVNPWPELKAALRNSANWRGTLPSEREVVATLRRNNGTESDHIVVHPMGSLEVRQRVLPLNLKLQKYGNAPLSDANIFKIVKGREENFSLISLKEHFAPAQFKEMSDTKKLSSPAFEKLDSGVQIKWDKNDIAFEVDSQVDFVLEYETSIIDEKLIVEPRFTGQLLWDSLGTYIISGSAAELSQANSVKKPRLELMEESYAIVNIVDLRLVEIPGNDGTLTLFETHQKLEEFLIQNPEKEGKIQIVPQFEVVK